MNDDLALELLRRLQGHFDDHELARDLTEDEARARWREVGLPMADFEDAAGLLQGEMMAEKVFEPMGLIGVDDEGNRDDDEGPDLGRCKVPHCTNPADAKLGPYGGLCVMHANEKKAERKASAKKAPRAEKAEKSTVPVEKALSTQDSAMRELLMDLVMLDDDELDLPALRLDAARLLLGR